MPSVTVVVSSDTDIYISPGLYGDCLPTSSTGGAAHSFRAGRVLFGVPRGSTRVLLVPLVHFMLAHTRKCAQWPGAGIHVTSTRWPSSK
ncbi:hypothetical protein GTY54_37850 [Streptomyces sp. SID625]|nr:hypothetical protein [Streptomyces sp. SID625]